MRGPLGVVIVAAGAGHRFGASDKALTLLAGKPMLEHSLDLFAHEPAVEQVVVVFGAHTLAAGAMLVAGHRLRDVSICTGGRTRGASALAGITHLDPEIKLVAIHDAARPLATTSLLRRVVAAARLHGAAIPGVPVSDTILSVDSERFVVGAPERGSLRAIQTPQVARRDWLMAALSARDTATDEGSLLHLAGFPVCVVEGDANNLKVTIPADLERAEALLNVSRDHP